MGSSISFSSKIVIPDQVLKREVGGESVILNLESELYFGLEEVGSRMLEVLIQSSSIQDAYEALLQEFDVSPEVLRKDLESFIQKLAENGIVEIHQSP